MDQHSADKRLDQNKAAKMNQPNNEVINAIRKTLDDNPENTALWLHFAELLEQAENFTEAIGALRKAIELDDEKNTAIRRLIPILRRCGQLSEAVIRIETQLEEEPEDKAMRLEYARILLAKGEKERALKEYLAVSDRDSSLKDNALEELRSGTDLMAEQDAEDSRQTALAGVVPETPELDEDEWASQFDWEDLKVSFEDVAGLQEVKDQIYLRIIAPFKQPEVYKAFRRSGGGGILMYGPPGCGKTYLARATAGECGARFLSIGINDIVDKYWGESEKIIHRLFEDARRNKPTVLFFDEFDALGSTRGRSESQFWKTLVDQLLQEMDGISGNNNDLLIFAATNVPWNVDQAFRRPGRFDRVFFIPPPDQKARVEILARHSAKLPGGDAIDITKLIKKTRLFTGADLRSLCERASDKALSASLRSGKVHPVKQDDFERELEKMQSSATEWLVTARNYAKYANEAGQFDDLAEFLKKVKKW
ncbi:AAA family ATPase [Planctomycetota bacterium]